MYKNDNKKIVLISILFIFVNFTFAFAAGWINLAGDYYYALDDGSYYKGFVIEGPKAYYCGTDGKMWKAPKDEYMPVYDELYDGKFFVDDKGVVSMNDNDGSHWVKKGNNWYHCSKDGTIDKDVWIYRKENDSIYRMGHDGKMCKGWVVDPETNISYYCDYHDDGGYVIMDNLGSTYEEVYKRLIEVINRDLRAGGGNTSTPIKERVQATE